MKTLKDVALYAGVSVATVSRVISGNYPVKETTRKRVLEAIGTLDYHPNGVARSLKNAKTYTLGVLVPDIANPYFVQLVRAVEASVEKLGYHLLVASSDEKASKESELIRVFLEKRLDGMIIAPVSVTPATDWPQLIVNALPIVLVDRILEGIMIDSVREESRQSSKELVTHLLGYGHRAIGIVNGRTSTTALERESGYREALQEAGIIPPEDFMVRGDYDHKTGYLAGKRFLSHKEQAPTAVFCTNNLIALGFLQAVHELGYRVPEDISIVSFGDPFEATFQSPKMTIVVQNPAEVGRYAAFMLLEKLDGKPGKNVEVILPTVIRLGDSVRAPREPAQMYSN
ncbi:MAG: LacI family transcriptional regulator [Sulfobacillus acidophilus]|uniref:LacI family transcriptional regulator n=1 Tax=Sulfobacillus acidophilus TaxID=53633 RepID=A0A2T2WJM7_9FIRM|nr:MAG: LacI family transcriptional regulator [Sulfobacillus acidophilus]